MSGMAEFNRPAFFKIEEQLKRDEPDCFVYNPARLNWDEGSNKDYMILALPMLITCTDLFVMLGSENSSGSTIERLLAIYCHLNITWED
jgi:hypothetical protein